MNATPRSPERVGDSPLIPVTSGIRRLALPDIPALISLARASLPDTMAARLGPAFAKRYFRALLTQEEISVDGYFASGRLVGFIIYTEDVAVALRAAFRRHALAFAFSLLPALLSVRRLAYVIRIGATVLAGAPEPGGDVPAEMLSIGLLPDYRGQRGESSGRVAHQLVERAFAHLSASGLRNVKVFCKPDEPVANGFVRREGFVLRGRVRRFGVDANLYVRPLASSVSPGVPA